MKPLVVLCVLCISGCGARIEVAKDKILSHVDALLGEIDVKRKEADIAIRNMDVGLDQLKHGKIEARVKEAHFSERVTEIEENIANADKALARLRDCLKQNRDVALSGKKFTPDQLKEMAQTALDARKKLAIELEGVKAARDQLAAVVVALAGREKAGRDKIKALKLLLEEVDAKSAALKSMKDASMLAGGGAALDFAKLEQQVKELSIKIDVELAFHDEKLKDAVPQSIDSVARHTSTASDVVANIDAIMGKK